MSNPEILLRSLGIVRPEDIDVEVIAWHCGLQVQYANLNGCDARIVGREDRGLLTVNITQIHTRRRFSVAHEIGHWQLHRGKLMMCRSEDIDGTHREAKGYEQDADAFAAALLMPRHLFVPAAVALAKKPPWKAAEHLSDLFQTSLLATALRMIALDAWPGWLAFHQSNGKGWAFKAPSAVSSTRPTNEVDYRSAAFDMLNGQGRNGVRSTQHAGDVWFSGAQFRRVEEHCRPYLSDGVLSFLRLI